MHPPLLKYLRFLPCQARYSLLSPNTTYPTTRPRTLCRQSFFLLFPLPLLQHLKIGVVNRFPVTENAYREKPGCLDYFHGDHHTKIPYRSPSLLLPIHQGRIFRRFSMILFFQIYPHEMTLLSQLDYRMTVYLYSPKTPRSTPQISPSVV